MGYPTKDALKAAIKEFTRQFYNEEVYSAEVEAHLERYSSGLSDILWAFLYDSKVQTQIDLTVDSGIVVQVNTMSGTGATTASGIGRTTELGTIIPPTP